jgi:hypothetical protein
MRLRFPAVLATFLALPITGLAESPEEGERMLGIELNALEAQEGACRLIFVAENATGTDLASLVLETVLFDQAGRVVALTLLDFRDLPTGRIRVRPFDMPGVDCDALDRLLINDVASCEGGLDCAGALSVHSRLDVELLQ